LLGRLASWTIFEGLTERQNWQAPNDEPEHRDIKVEIKSSDPNKQGGGAALEPDRAQLSIFISALFRYAASGNFISLRSFHENRGSSKPFLIDPIKLNGVAFTLEKAAFNAPPTPKRKPSSRRRSPPSRAQTRLPRPTSPKAWSYRSSATRTLSKRADGSRRFSALQPSSSAPAASGSTRKPVSWKTSSTFIGGWPNP
jgi:hypothetical protein